MLSTQTSIVEASLLPVIDTDVLSAVVKENKHQNTKDTKCRRGYAEMNLRLFISVRGSLVVDSRIEPGFQQKTQVSKCKQNQQVK